MPPKPKPLVEPPVNDAFPDTQSQETHPADGPVVEMTGGLPRHVCGSVVQSTVKLIRPTEGTFGEALEKDTKSSRRI